MPKSFDPEAFLPYGLSIEESHALSSTIESLSKQHSKAMTWKHLSKELRGKPFDLQLFIFSTLFPDWPGDLESAPAWIPDADFIAKTHIAAWMQELSMTSVKEFHQWTVDHYSTFWQRIIQTLAIPFHRQPAAICSLELGIESPEWLPGAKLNIAESCFTAAPDKTALIFLDQHAHLQKQSYDELNRLSNRVANSLLALHFQPQDAIAIIMPMTAHAVAIYLGIIKMGGIVVSIADSFSADEIATRLRIAKVKAVFTQDVILRSAKQLPLYEKVVSAKSPFTIVKPAKDPLTLALQENDLVWDDFLIKNEEFTAFSASPMSPCNILFSSGTTGDPKAIPWNHTTPIKSASDAYFHHDIKNDDILAWPTNLGWMMGPWLIFAAFLNKATIALYHDVPNERAFGQFIAEAKVTMLGVVPALVANWRSQHSMEGLNWSSIRRFSSTGECSNPEDMLYLMSLAGYKPIIEYCGGTETGGGYISSTLLENNYPSLFTTPAMGIDFLLLDENQTVANDGEVVLLPPSIGLSSTLLNADHHSVYYANMPRLPNKTVRRHGDHIVRLPEGHYCILGRIDDTMNLGGIKISAAEIERVLVGIEQITETAAIAVPFKSHGPDQLIIYAATLASLSKDEVKKIMQCRINQHLNPLFKIHDLVFIRELPKTASNKIMRRILRKEYLLLTQKT